MDEAERLEPRNERGRLKKAYGQLFSDVTAILARHDPVGLVGIGVPEDEYEPEVGTILQRLRGATNPADVQRIVCEEFDLWFGLDTPKMAKDDFLPVAAEIFGGHGVDPGSEADDGRGPSTPRLASLPGGPGLGLHRGQYRDGAARGQLGPPLLG